MTPAIRFLKDQNVDFKVHQYSHDKKTKTYGEEALEKLGVGSELVFKTLVVCLDEHELVVAVLPVLEKLSMKKVAHFFEAKKAHMAEKNALMRSTGYILGGVSPLAQKKRLRTLIHQSAFNVACIFVSAGKRGMDIELSALQLQTLVGASQADICV
ncbi:ybaK/ebsC protein [Psychromonas sp. CNPT3]|uniref:Cys-tRNA(Pro) deacylase n=1 Tax=Psychromonas sp. CNPT3 TaxID=314282 RepID=UPI00006E769B|nr:Cys-tRNA(Pro) deacylase [Psychromonas sp. CNPT3]AGH81678.1 ybaK/ebsC protein [Psychromonas sp. CNPT3]